jgi:hypothetical protein
MVTLNPDPSVFVGKARTGTRVVSIYLFRNKRERGTCPLLWERERESHDGMYTTLNICLERNVDEGLSTRISGSSCRFLHSYSNRPFILPPFHHGLDLTASADALPLASFDRMNNKHFIITATNLSGAHTFFFFKQFPADFILY